MRILVDTSCWSLLLRRRQDLPDSPALQELKELIHELRACLIGPVRQELLSGIREERQFLLLRDRLRAFPDDPLTSQDYEQAARYLNLCRKQGVQGASTDFLLCAVSVRRRMPIFTTDNDFQLYAQHLPVKLHSVRDGLYSS